MGLFLAFLAYLWWGFAPLFWKLLMGVPSVHLIAHRVVWSFPFLLLMVALRGRMGFWWSGWRDSRMRRIHAAAAVMLAVNWLTFVWAILHGRVLEVSFGYFLCPLLSVGLGAFVEGERLGWLRWLAIGAAGVGVGTLGVASADFPVAGSLMAASWAVYGLLKKRTAAGALSGLTYEVTWMLPLSLSYLILSGSGLEHLTHPWAEGREWWLAAAAGIVTTVPLLFYAEAAKTVRLSTLGVLQYTVPTCNFALAILVFGESFGPVQQVAFGAIWTGLLLYAIGSLPRKARKEEPSAVVTRSTST